MKSTLQDFTNFVYNNFMRGLLLPMGGGDNANADMEPALQKEDAVNNNVVDWDNDGLEVGQRVVWLWVGFSHEDSLPLPPGSYAGVLRWLGSFEDVAYAGVEFDQRLDMTSGYVGTIRLFECKPDHGGFVFPNALIPEKYIDIGLPMVPMTQILPPLGTNDLARITEDRSNGIQGGRNSCYMDTTIFAMFGFSSVFDGMLLGEPWNGKPDVAEDMSIIAQRILRETIVNPLRKTIFCSDINMQKLRSILEQLDKRFGADEMDPQEFMEILFREVFHLDGFIQLQSGESDFLSQVLCQQNEDRIPTVQELFTESVRFQSLKFQGIPSPALLLQMPRSGPDFRMFRGILPSLSIDISEVLDGPKVQMDLFAVICIATNHFVTFVKTGKERLAPWILFNSMAKQEIVDGQIYTVPMIWSYPRLGSWLNNLEKQPDMLSKALDENVPDELRQIISDTYICFYAPASEQSSEMTP